MKNSNRIIVATAALSIGIAAHAAPITGQISLAGYADAIGFAGMGAATGIDFVSSASGSTSPGIAGGLTSYGPGTGSFDGFGCTNANGDCGVIKDIVSFATSAPISTFLTFTTGGPAISFDLSTITSVVHGQDATGGSVTLMASGIIHESGFDDTAGVFTLTAQGDQITSYSATLLVTPPVVAAVPEPESIALLGLGLIALAAVRRKARRS